MQRTQAKSAMLEDGKNEAAHTRPPRQRLQLYDDRRVPPICCPSSALGNLPAVGKKSPSAEPSLCTLGRPPVCYQDLRIPLAECRTSHLTDAVNDPFVSAMNFDPLLLAGAFRIGLDTNTDDRGFFARRFCAEIFARRGLETDFVQRSISFNARRGTLRGLHFQAPPALEAKIVRCTRGAAFDVIVDLRRGSPTFGRWHGEEITADNRIMLYVPKGFAHGFQTLLDQTELDYEITPAYVPGAGRGVRFDDPDLAIPWPVGEMILSSEDRALGTIDSIDPL